MPILLWTVPFLRATVYAYLEWEIKFLDLPPSALPCWGEPNGKVPQESGDLGDHKAVNDITKEWEFN